MSSSKTNYVVAKMMCFAFIISLVGSRIAVNGRVIIDGSALSNNRPSHLLSTATAINTAFQSGQISQAQAHQQAQYAIQANRDKVNLALINGLGK